MSLPYYKRFPRDFLEGTIGLSFEEKGAYAIVLDLIYMRDGRLPDDARYIAGQLGCSVRKWSSLLAALVAAGKLHVENGFISNFRADYLLEETRKYRDKQAEIASLPRKNNNLPQPETSQSEPEPEEVREDIKKEREREFFDEALAAFPESGRHVTDEPMARAAWNDAAADVAEEELLSAVLRFASAPQPRKRDLVPSMQRWLTGRRYRAFLAKPDVAKLTTGGWTGPADLRAAVAAEAGEGVAASYIDPSAWSDGTIVARTAYGADQLRGLRALSGVTIRVADKAAV